jgi:hypothetical protein
VPKQTNKQTKIMKTKQAVEGEVGQVLVAASDQQSLLLGWNINPEGAADSFTMADTDIKRGSSKNLL